MGNRSLRYRFRIGQLFLALGLVGLILTPLALSVGGPADSAADSSPSDGSEINYRSDVFHSATATILLSPGLVVSLLLIIGGTYFLFTGREHVLGPEPELEG